MAAIQQGAQLRKVTEEEKEATKALPALDGLAGALSSALSQRAAVIQDSDDDESDEDWDDDDEWDD